MKRVFYLLSFLCLIILSLSGCSEVNFNNIDNSENISLYNNIGNIGKSSNDFIENQFISSESNTTPLVIYTVNDDLTNFVRIEDEIDGDLNLFTELINKLKANEVLKADVECRIGGLSTSNELILDFNEAFLTQLTSYGSIMEYYTVACVVNSFLDSFDLNSVTILVDGEQFETGHSVYDFSYTSIIE